MNRFTFPTIVVLVSAWAVLAGAKRAVHLKEQFDVEVEAKRLVINGSFERIFDKDLWYKLESGVTKPIFIAVILTDESRNVVSGQAFRVDVWYDGLAEKPYFVLTFGDRKQLKLAERKQLVQHLSHLKNYEFPIGEPLKPGQYRLRVEVKVNPWTKEQLAKLNRTHQPLRHINIFKTTLFDNSKFRPQREFVVTSQLFPIGSGGR